jgi:hypothetical protein
LFARRGIFTAQAEIRVKPGLKVHGGQSILGILDHQNPLKRPN